MVGVVILSLLAVAIYVPLFRRARADHAEVEVGTTPAYDDLLGTAIPHGTRLDDYVRNGLEDLRIYLVQHARHREDHDGR